MAECWDQMSAGMKVEVACGEEGVTKDAFWVATVIAIAGRTKEQMLQLLSDGVIFVFPMLCYVSGECDYGSKSGVGSLPVMRKPKVHNSDLDV